MKTNVTAFTYPEKLRPGDKVAILSPSSGLPEIFPVVLELGLQRLQELFQLVPVEYPTTRKYNSSPAERARDIHAAFLDPEIKAIICSIGGDDQIKVLKYLDADLLKAHPKAFFGYSDNTNLQVLLWNLGIVSYYGGSIMAHFGRGGAMHPYTVDSLKKALFSRGEYEIQSAPEYNDIDVDWERTEKLQEQPAMFPNTGLHWLNDNSVIEGTTWGGNLEILDWQLSVSKYILPVEAYAGNVLFVETSEEMPSATAVYRILMCMGERGLLRQFAAILVARPKAWSFTQQLKANEKITYILDQKKAVQEALREYNSHALAVFNLDFGHTDPQVIVPNGGHIRIDGIQRRIFVTY